MSEEIVSVFPAGRRLKKNWRKLEKIWWKLGKKVRKLEKNGMTVEKKRENWKDTGEYERKTGGN